MSDQRRPTTADPIASHWAYMDYLEARLTEAEAALLEISLTPIGSSHSNHMRLTADAYFDQAEELPKTQRPECVWTECYEDESGEEDGAVFTTACGERVEPAPGLQAYCHMCGRKLKVVTKTEGGTDHE